MDLYFISQQIVPSQLLTLMYGRSDVEITSGSLQHLAAPYNVYYL